MLYLKVVQRRATKKQRRLEAELSALNALLFYYE